MNNMERLEFLKKKPAYDCRFHPTDWWHETGCPHRSWTNQELQNALDMSKRSGELHMWDLNNPRKQNPGPLPSLSVNKIV